MQQVFCKNKSWIYIEDWISFTAVITAEFEMQDRL